MCEAARLYGAPPSRKLCISPSLEKPIPMNETLDPLKGTVPRFCCHPERSGAESKDPLLVTSGAKAGQHKCRPSAIGTFGFF